MAQREFVVYRSHHGPIVRIAYFHANFVPGRDPGFDWTKPVDGSDPATQWQGVHSVNESPNVFNPKSGWLYNTNNAPWSAAGPDSPKQRDYPSYVDGAGENPRGVHAVRVLSQKKDFTPDSVVAAAFDTQMPELEIIVPSLVAAVTDKLVADFGKWQVPWSDINRFQRRTGDIEQPFSDSAPSIAVPFTTGRWGSLASFGASSYQGSKKIYGASGNSFLAIVEFGDKVKAKAITAGGQSGNPESPHFSDQAARYAKGDLREVYFYPEQLQGHTERTYHPGEPSR